jgi:nucleotide-binding universal stress UspA family protein
VLAAALAYRSRPPRSIQAPATARRVLLPFTGDGLDRTVLDAAIRIARAEGAVLVPAYLVRVPLEYPEDSPLAKEVGVAMPLLEAIEHAALRCGVPVDARIEKGRTPTHALRKLWAVEQFDRVIAPAPADNRDSTHGGFTPKDVIWILAHAPAETLVLKPGPPTDDDDAVQRTLSVRTAGSPSRSQRSKASRIRTRARDRVPSR